MNMVGQSNEHKHYDFFYGWGAGCVETIVLYPSYKIIFRQQLHGFVTKDAWNQIRSEGIPLLYRGLLPPLIMRTTSRSLMFGLVDEFTRAFECPSSSTLTFCHARAAMLAGLAEAAFCPLERVQVLLQTSAYHKQFRNTSEAFQAVRPFGIREYYRGMSLISARNSLANALFFTLRDPFREVVVARSSPLLSPSILPLFADFCSGALLGASISTIFFPLNVTKNRMQSYLGTPFENPLTVFLTILRERNFSLAEVYRGVSLNFTRSLLAWGITNSVYELLKRHINCAS